MEANKLEKKLSIEFLDKKLLITALTHRSYLNENHDDAEESNERLEFLGDAVLQFLSSECLFKKLPTFQEGELTNIRSRIVNTESLSFESTRLGVGEYIRISKGERETAYESNSILANTFEAILGAIYLDQGMDVCRTYLEKNLFYKVDDIVEKGEFKDSKSLFQEISQEQFNITPYYRVVEDIGPDHDKTFRVGVFLNELLITDGEGSSKRKAQQEAAQKAIDMYKTGRFPEIISD